MGDVIDFPAGRRGRAPSEATFTIKDVADACGLPQPAIAQLVSRTWTDAGWMYTAEQMQEAVEQAKDLRAQVAGSGPGREDRSGAGQGDATTVAARMAIARSLHPSADPADATPT
ncbi:MAG: hypothetical protein ACRDUB_00925 [Mycobacterium sp.]